MSQLYKRIQLTTVLLSLLCSIGYAQTTSVVKTFTTPGLSGIVFGAGVTTASVSLWGGGGGGSAGGMKEYVNAVDYILHYGAGGGGANWAGSSFSVIPGAFYPFTVGSGGAAGGLDGNGEPMSGGNGTDSYFLNGTVISYGAKGGTIVGFHAYGGARGANSFPDPGPPYAEDGESEYPNTTFGGDGGLSNNSPYGPSGINVNGNSGLGWPRVQGLPSGGPGTRPGDGGGGGGFTGLPWPFAGMLAERRPGGKGANGSVTFYVSYPTYKLTTNPVAAKRCGPGSTIITLRSTTLFPGTYTVTYNTTNPTTTGNTAGMTWNAAGYGTFTTIPLSSTSAITITNLASGNTCSDAITAFNTVTAVIENTGANSWMSKLDAGTTTRSNAFSFTVGSKAYVGTGKNGTSLLNDVWEYDQATSSWTQVASFGGGARADAVGFGIGSKGYAGTGSDGSNNKNDLWQYDPFTNVWTEKAAFIGQPRHSAIAVTMGSKGYIGLGANGTTHYIDFNEYDPATDSWTAKAVFANNVSGAGRTKATAFSIGTRTYVGMGLNNLGAYTNDMWQYDLATNSWTAKTGFPGAARNGAMAFSLGSRGYVGTGGNASTNYNDFYEFDPGDNIWIQRGNFPGGARKYGVGFAISSKGYFGTGIAGSTSYKDLYEYSVSNTIISTGSVAPNSFCAGSSIVIPFTTGCGAYAGGNIFTAQLSNSQGSFVSPVNIGTSSTVGSITATIPAGTAVGTKYRVRVIASNPSTVGTDNGADIGIRAASATAVSAGISATSICRGQSINLNASVSTASTSDTTLILSENFNTGAASWLMTNSSSYINYNELIYTNGQSGYHSNDNSSFYITSSTPASPTGITNTVLQSPEFSTLGMNSGSLTFYHTYYYGHYNNSDSIRVLVSVNQGQTWTRVYLNNSSDVGDAQDSTGFIKQTISLDDFMNQPSVVVRFAYGARGGMGKWMIDNISIKGVSNTNNFTWTSNPAGFTSNLQNPTGIIPTAIPGTTVYTVAFTNNFGCGTVSNNVSVLVKDTSRSTTVLSICPGELPYSWNGLTFNAAGTQTKTLVNAAGCDSLATLILNIKPNTTSSTSISICPSELPYSWNGLTFNSAGSQTAHFINSVGCDSAATLNLVVRPASTYTTNLSICETALPYVWNGLTFNAAGSQTAHFTNSVGCDSAVTLNLTTVPSIVTATANLTYVCPGASVNLQASSPTGGTVTIMNEKFNSTHNNWTTINLSSGGIVENAAWTLRPNNYSPLQGLTYNSNDNSQFYLSSSFAQGTPVTTNTILQSPPFSTVGLSTASLSFYHDFLHQNNFANDSIRVQVSSDGINWTNIYFNKTTSVGSQSGFALQTISLNGYLNLPALRLRFNYNGSPLVGGYSNYYWAIDNILVSGTLAPNSYSWSSVPAGFSSSLQNPATINPAQTATYNVTANNGFCSKSGSVTVVVNVSNPTSVTNLAVCPASMPYSWNGLTFNAPGTQTAHIMTPGGCDSAATLNLTLKATSSSVTNISICPSGLPYTWNGLVFNAAGTQVKHLVNSVGCDSAATLNLTVQTSSSSSVTTLTICETQLPYTWNGLVLTASGRQTKLLTNIYGCDSVAMLNLIVSEKPGNINAGASSVSVCSGTAFNLTSSSVAPTILLNENFNGASNGWIKQNSSTGGSLNAAAWTLRPAGYLFLGAIAVQSNDATQFYMSDSYTQGQGPGGSTSNTNTFLQSPAFNTMGYTAASLTFYQVYADKDGNDFGRVQVSTDNGTTWTTVVNQTTFLGAYTNFALQTVSLNAYVNLPSVMIRFNYVAVNGYFWGIDNVKVTGTAAAPSYSWSSVPGGFSSNLQNPTGVIATESSVYKVTVTNANGCSDVNTVAVPVKPLSTSSSALTICPSALPYIWNGVTFNAAGTQTAHLLNSAGCDSAATLSLSVKAASTSSTNISLCPSALPYTWNGLTFTGAGTQTAHFQNSVGCDSAASLTLTLKPVSTSTTNITICESALPYTWNGLTFSAAGTQTAHFENSVGCDSAASLILAVNPSPTNLVVSASTASVCEGGSVDLFASSTTPAGGVNVVLLSEDFNAATNNWVKVNQSTGGSPAAAAWTLRPDGYTPAGAPVMHSNDNSQFYLSNSDAQGNGGHTNTTLQSPTFSTVGYSTATLSFYHLYFNSDAFYDRIKVQVSADGVNWSDVYVSSAHVYSGANYGFALQTISLNGFLNKPALRVRFNYDCFWGFRWGIDNVKVTGTPLNNYTWASAPAGYGSSLQNPTAVIPTMTSEYTVTVSTSNGCTLTGSVLVAVSPGPSATIAYEGLPCTADGFTTVTHSGTTGGVYSSTPGLVLDASTGTVTFAGSTPGIYEVTYTIAASGTCPEFATTASVTVPARYEITASAGANGSISSPGVTSVCEGSNVTYNITPAACASITDVLVNGSSVGAVSSYTFTNVSAANSITAVFSAGVPQPAIACYQQATFNSNTCQWVITGTQPTQPTTACYETAVFDTATCAWVVTGTQPTEPTAVNCWDDYQFNTTECSWINMGSQPSIPALVNCWDNYQFDTNTCTWVNIGTQLPEPPRINCWDNFQFDPATCVWVNVGTQPAPPTPVNCWDNYEFNSNSCSWVNIGTQLPEPPRSNCWDNYQFNPATCAWVNAGTQPAPPTPVNCWDNYQFNTTECSWINLGIQPAQPTPVNCWDNFQFDNATCGWINTGTQPTQPAAVNCWDNFQFNTASCTWENIGVQSAAPVISTSGALTVCANSTVSLTSSTNANNQWYFNGNIMNGETGVMLTAAAAGTYTVATIVNGCSSLLSSPIVVGLTNYTITVDAGANGSISPSTGTVNCGDNANYTITANGGYAIDDVVVDGISQGAIASYSFNDISSDHSISATFIVNTVNFTITATAGAGGTITPNGLMSVPSNGNQSYSFVPNACYSVADVLVDGVSQGAITTYTFTNVTANHTISASFVANGPLTTPVVAGPTNVCQYIGTGEQVVYTASSAGATSFTWVVPPTNVTIVSGQGTPTLTVTFSSGFTAQANKQIKVTGLSSCGNSSQTIYYLLAQAPNTAQPITGPTNVCPIIGTANTFTYSIPAVTGATSYIWTAQAGTTVVTNNGTSADIAFSNGFTTSAVTVSAVNGCGTSTVRSLTVSKVNPSTPGLISGPTNVCANMAPGGTPATYSVMAVPGATTYTWSVSNGISFSGQGTNSISIIYPNGFVSGIISVMASNGCGTSGVRTLAVARLSPATPGVIDVIQTSACPNRVYTYTLASMPSNATSVQWTVPADAIGFIGQGTTSITVTYPATAVSGIVAAQAWSNCGSSVIRRAEVKLPACPPTQPGEFTRVAGGQSQDMENVVVNVYPNPTTSAFKLQVNSPNKEKVYVRILDAQGRAFKAFTVMPQQSISIGSELKAGAYLLETRQGNVTRTTKLLKF